MKTPPSKPERAKQIEEAAEQFRIRAYSESKFSEGEFTDGATDDFFFTSGAEWADANPERAPANGPEAAPSDEPESSELERMKYWMNQYLQAYAPEFFDEPEGFTPKLDMNSAALVRYVLKKILNPPSEKEGEV